MADKSHNQQKGADSPTISSGGIDRGQELLPLVATCPAGISWRALRTFLFEQQQGLDGDRAVGQHIGSGCGSCKQRIEILQVTEPQLRESGAIRAVHSEEALPIDTPPPGEEDDAGAEESAPAGSGSLSRSTPPDPRALESLRSQVARKMAGLLMTPAAPLTLEILQQMDQSVRGLPAGEQRSGLIRQITGICDARWGRLAQETRSIVETAAAQLYTRLSAPPDAGPPASAPAGMDEAEEVLEDLRSVCPELADADKQRDEEKQRAFLVYMMSRPWFLNPGGAAVWTTEIGDDGQTERVLLSFDRLREALREGRDA